MYRVTEPELSSIPEMWRWIATRAQRVIESKMKRKCKEFNQLILNEYAPSQGINPHTDKTHCFGPVIPGLSLFSSCVIEFREKLTGMEKSVLLIPRSLFVLTGPSRYEWSHGISKKKEHKFCGHTIRR